MAIFPKVHRRSRWFVAELKRNYIYSAVNSRVHKLHTFEQSLLIDILHILKTSM